MKINLLGGEIAMKKLINTVLQLVDALKYFFMAELPREFWEGDGIVFCLIWGMLIPVLILNLVKWLP